MRKKLLTLLSMVFAIALALSFTTMSAFADTTTVDYAKDSTKWVDAQNMSIGEDGISATAASFNAVTTPIGGNSSVEIVYDANLPDGAWDSTKLMVKVTDPAAYTWHAHLAGQTVESAQSSGNWIAFNFGNADNPGWYECVDGVVTYTRADFANDTYSFNQRNVFVITTTDTDEGVTVTLNYTATDCRNAGVNLPGTTETLTYKSTNTKLWGAGAVSIGRFGGGVLDGTDYITYNVNVTDVASDYEYVAPTPVDYAKSADNWKITTGMTFDGTTMNATAAAYNVVTKSIGGNSTVKVVEDGYITSDHWSYQKIMVKVKDAGAYSWEAKEGNTSSVGNWLAFAYGCSQVAAIYECVDGVVTKVATLGGSGYDGNSFWHTANQKNTIEITTQDTENGVTITVSSTATDSRHEGLTLNGNTYTVSYTSTNVKLWGEGSVVIGRNGGGSTNFTNGETIKYNVEVTDVESDYVYTEPVGDPVWEEVKGGVQEGKIVNVNKPSDWMVSAEVGGNSNATIVIDENLVGATWQKIKIYFKCDTELAYSWSTSGEEYPEESAGNWLCLVIDNGTPCTALFECIDGVVSKVAYANNASITGSWNAVSGYDNWYLYQQVNTFTVKTTDTDNGVDVVATFTASGSKKSENTGNTYTYTYSSVNKKLWGAGFMAVTTEGDGEVGEEGTKFEITTNLNNVASEYNIDVYYAGLVEDKINALATEINAENYNAMVAAYNDATASYAALTEAQQAFISSEIYAKVSACKTALDAYAKIVALAELEGKIEALPVEVTAENYATAKVAIEEAENLYASLNDEEKAEIDNADVLAAASAKLDAFEADLAAANAVDEEILALPTTIDRINYNSDLVAQIEAVVDAYEDLTAAQQALVEEYDTLEAVLEALEAYELVIAEPAADPENLAQDKDNWNKYGNAGAGVITWDNYGMSIPAATGGMAKAMLLRKNIKADSTISVKFDSQIANGIWGQNFIMFKNMENSETLVANAPIVAMGQDNNTSGPAGTWMALVFGDSSSLLLLICEDGELEKIDLNKRDKIPASEYNEAVQQITEITITTTDIAEGVDVEITYKASGYTGVLGNTYTITHSVLGDAFKGDYAVSVGSYNGGAAGTKVIVSDLRVTAADGENALVNRVDDNYVNFATDLKYWKTGSNVNAFEFTETGMEMWDFDKGGMLLNHMVQDTDTIKVAVDANLNASWGNLYFVFKHKEPTMLYNGTNFPQAAGNYLVLMIGADGIKIFECVNGTLNATLGSNGVVTGGTDFSTDFDGNDIWYIYKNYTKVEIYTEDVEDGVEVAITVKAPSGKVYNIDYFSKNTALHGDSYFSIEYFLGAKPSSINGLVKIESVKIEGVTEGFVPNVNVTELNSQISATASISITAENVEDVRTALAGYKATALTLNYTLGKELNNASITRIEDNIKAYEADVAMAVEVDAVLATLPQVVNAENYESATTMLISAKSAYNALGAAGKALIANKAKLDGCEEAIALFEADLAAADAVVALISAVPALAEDQSNYTEVSDAITAAEEAYEALTDAQKALVSNYQTLVDLRANLPPRSCFAGFGMGSVFAFAALAIAAAMKKKAE